MIGAHRGSPGQTKRSRSMRLIEGSFAATCRKYCSSPVGAVAARKPHDVDEPPLERQLSGSKGVGGLGTGSMITTSRPGACNDARLDDDASAGNGFTPSD